MKNSAKKIKIKKSKSVTIDDLAVMVANGFDRMEDRIGGVEDRIGGVEDRIGGVEDRIGGVEQELKDTKVELKADISELRDVVKATRRDVLDIGDRFVQRYEFNGLLTRVGKLEQKVEGKSK